MSSFINRQFAFLTALLSTGRRKLPHTTRSLRRRLLPPVACLLAAQVAVTTAAPVAGAVQVAPSPALLSAVSCRTVRMCVAVGTVYAYGTGYQMPVAETWNGHRWATQPIGQPEGATNAALHSVSCATPVWCMAVGTADGHALAEQWDGTRWSVVAAPSLSGATLSAVSCLSAAYCLAVGSAGQTLAARWDGTHWTVLPSPSPAAVSSELTGVSCYAPESCTAVGQYRTSDQGVTAQLAERWNGASWTIQATPTRGVQSWLTSVSCTSATACTAVGQMEVRRVVNHHHYSAALALAERWNGKSWITQPIMQGIVDDPTLTGVACAGAKRCIAVGWNHCCAAGGLWGPIAARWSGTTWRAERSVEPPGHGFSELLAVSCAGPHQCEAVGETARGIQYATGPLAEHWNGKLWAIQATS